ncbi:MAG: hypothetical protein KAX49_14210 [Halanaerobiales bacterium]|nr:hypothetical protein [Halanaerobiales bacterium]
MKKILIALFSLLLISGCSFINKDVDNVGQSISEIKNIQAAKEEAHETFATAHEEFFDGVPSIVDRGSDVESLSVEEWGVKEYIIGYAFEAYNTGNVTKLENFLKEQGLYEKYRAVVEKYDLEEQQNVLDMRPSTISTQSFPINDFDNYLDGDVFVCYGGSSSAKLIGFFIPGTWKHAGFLDTQAPDMNAPILTASDETTSGFCVGYETKLKWSEKTAVSVWRPYGRTYTKARAALNYSKQFVGKPYSVFTSRSSNDDWYCSKVVYRGWLSQGINLEDEGWLDTWVTPSNLAEDGMTYWVGGDYN